MGVEASMVVPEVLTQSRDPFLMSLVFLASAIVGIVAVAKPLMGLYRDFKSTRTEGSRADAEVAWYTNLQAQIENNSKAIDRLQTERNKWFETATLLEKEVERLKTFEESVLSMKERLNEKDKIIAARDSEIRHLTRSILEMKDRIHALELRLVSDERKVAALCEGCQHKQGAQT